MLREIEKNIWLKIGFSILCLLLVYYLRNVLLPFAVSFLAAYILNPVVNFFNRFLKKRIFSVILTLIILCGILFGIYELIFPSMFEEINSLYVSLKDKALSEYIPSFVAEYIKNFAAETNLKNLLESGDFPRFLNSILPKISNFFSETFNFLSSIFGLSIIILYTIFIMKDYDELSRGFINLIPPKHEENLKTFIRRFQKQMNNYFRGQILVVMCVMFLYSAGFKIIGLPLGITLGVLIGILNLVPYLQIAGFLPALLLTVIKSVETDSPLWIAVLMTAAVFVTVQIVQDMILTPYFMGKHTGLNPAMILLSLSVWGKLLGFLGLIVAIPFTCLVITYYGEYLSKKREGEKSG
jgi:predicted PurR-regulated permease PerM